jgi:uncharacterized DUF497 family protein
MLTYRSFRNTKRVVDIEFDPKKNQRNIAERDMSFELADHFDFDGALIEEDTRFAYPEQRFTALGDLNGRICFLAFSVTRTGIRVISLRKANKREVGKYEKKTAH